MNAHLSPLAALVARYLEAKDFNRPALAPDIWLPDAVLTYSIATGSIAFPERTEGREAITTTLISGFGTRFDRCRTYIVVEEPPPGHEGTPVVPWLVIMREIAASVVRVGKGWYRWTGIAQPDGRALASALHIHIELMEPFPDPSGRVLEQLQAPLAYPWLAPGALDRAMSARAAEPGLEFAEAYRRPASVPSAG